jgi:outer membrane protein
MKRANTYLSCATRQQQTGRLPFAATATATALLLLTALPVLAQNETAPTAPAVPTAPAGTQGGLPEGSPPPATGASAVGVAATGTPTAATNGTRVITSTAPAVPDGSSPLTLDDAVLLALRNHGDVGAAEQGFVSAREGITSARSGFFPDVSAGLNYNYAQRNGTNRTTTVNGVPIPISGGNTSNTTSSVVVSQNIFDSGRTRAQVRSARARTLGAVGGFGSARSNLAYEVASNFYEQLRQEKLVAQREGQVQLANQQLEQIQAQIEQGVAARVDAQGIQVNLSQARFDLTTARNALATAQTNFRNALGLSRGPALKVLDTELAREEAPTLAAATLNPVPSEDLLEGRAPTPLPFPTVTAAPLPIVPELQRLDDYLAEARRLRPDLVQAQATIQQSQASLDLAEIELKPQVTANAGYNIDPRSTSDRGFTFGAGISIPIFNAGGRKADVKAAEADLESNRIRLQQLTKDVEADVQSTFINISGGVERISNARELVLSARTNLATATERYQLGLGIVLDIVNAQTQLFNAQTSATQAIYDYELARADLDRAIGRFAWANPDQPAPTQAPTTIPAALAVTNVQK